MSRMAAFTSMLLGLCLWGFPAELCWDSFMDTVSKGHTCIVLVPAEVWAAAVSPQILVAALWGCQLRVWFGLEGNKVFPNSKNTLWKAWSFSVLLVFLVKAVQDNLFHSGCSSTTLSLISVLFWSYHMAGWELLNCTDGMLGTVGKRATSSTINLNAYISPLEIPYFVKA